MRPLKKTKVAWKATTSEHVLIWFCGIPRHYLRNSASLLAEFRVTTCEHVLIWFCGIPRHYLRNSASLLAEFHVTTCGIPCHYLRNSVPLLVNMSSFDPAEFRRIKFGNSNLYGLIWGSWKWSQMIPHTKNMGFVTKIKSLSCSEAKLLCKRIAGHPKYQPQTQDQFLCKTRCFFSR